MLEHLTPEKILFLDIETVPQHASFDQLPEAWKKLWEAKSAPLRKVDTDTPESLYPRAALFAEFGKIICISAGYISTTPEGRRGFRLKSFASHDEKEVLRGFAGLLEKHYSRPESRLCAHNGKEFDFPFIARRMVVNGLQLPPMLDSSNKRPWETSYVDTMELWKFGSYNYFAGLNLLATTLGVPTPKDDIDGSQVWWVYWKDNDLDRIVTYCQKDVLTVAQLFLRYRNEPLIREEDVIIAGQEALGAR